MPGRFNDIEGALRDLYAPLTQLEQQFNFLLDKVHPAQRSSALNLLQYLYLRSCDLVQLQEDLHLHGFSTLTNTEGYVQGQLMAVMQHFNGQVNGQEGDPPCDYFTSRRIAGDRAAALFGTEPGAPVPAIMVTFKTSFANDLMMVKKLLKAGMNIARINCAHDNEDTWRKMVRTIREVSTFTGIPCRILVDLAGPKIRTRVRGKKNRVVVEEEDILLLTDVPGIKSKLPVIECSIPGIAQQLRVGERVFFDDGLIEARVVGLKKEAAELEIVQVSSRKPFLKTEKGINFPDSHLSFSALSEYDRKCLPFIMEHADMVGFSYVHTEADVSELQDALGNRKLPIILKIETPDAMRNLPSLLFTAMKEELYGVMIARGDLAVELGFENISQAQEEILHICRAAHAPVIYATQILENMNKSGLPTRAEVTDAALGIWADCVMLNKGVHTARVVLALRNILQAKSEQVFGHYPVLRPLKISTAFFSRHPFFQKAGSPSHA